jgi:hypothetical protein
MTDPVAAPGVQLAFPPPAFRFLPLRGEVELAPEAGSNPDNLRARTRTPSPGGN